MKQKSDILLKYSNIFFIIAAVISRNSVFFIVAVLLWISALVAKIKMSQEKSAMNYFYYALIAVLVCLLCYRIYIYIYTWYNI